MIEDQQTADSEDTLPDLKMEALDCLKRILEEIKKARVELADLNTKVAQLVMAAGDHHQIVEDIRTDLQHHNMQAYHTVK